MGVLSMPGLSGSYLFYFKKLFSIRLQHVHQRTKLNTNTEHNFKPTTKTF